MPENAPVVIVPANFPEGYCPPDWQTLARDLANGMSGYVPGAYNFWNFGNSEPGVNDRGKPWLRLNPDNSPDKVFIFFGGGWVWPNPIEASSEERKIFVGIEADVWSYDGGDGSDPSATAPTDAAGAMWEVDHDFDFRFPLGAGTSPAPASTTVNVTDTGGEEDHTLLQAELPDVTLKMFTDEIVNNPGDPSSSESVAKAASATPSGAEFEYRVQKGTTEPGLGTTSPMGDGDEHNNMPPYRGVFYIKRTARRFFVP